MSARFSLEFPICEASQVGHARRTCVEVAKQSGCDDVAAGRLAIVINELGTNLVKHARDGLLIFNNFPVPDGQTLEIISIDRGPGMADVQKCLTDGYSSAGSAGTGLGAVRRLSEEWDLFSRPGSGTVQVARLACGGEPAPARVRVSGVSLAAPGETHCGDAWLCLGSDSVYRILVADGLGHGPFAAEAAHAAVAALSANSRSPPPEVLLAAHQALRATRGAAVAVAELDLTAQTLRYAGIGNISAQILAQGRTQNLVSSNGTLGAQSPRPREFNYSLPPGAVAIFFSDGLTSHVRLDQYPGLVQRDPGVIAGVVYRDFKRGRDDATVVVAATS